MAMPLQDQVRQERYVISSVVEADRVAQKVLSSKRRAEEMIEHFQRQIDVIKATYENESAFYRAALEEYFDTLPARNTTTTQKYALPSAELVRTKAKLDYALEREDKDRLVDWLKANGYGEYVKTKEEAAWGEFKKQLVIDGDRAVMKDTGEFVDCVPVVQKPARFDVKEGGANEEF